MKAVAIRQFLDALRCSVAEDVLAQAPRVFEECHASFFIGLLDGDSTLMLWTMRTSHWAKWTTRLPFRGQRSLFRSERAQTIIVMIESERTVLDAAKSRIMHVLVEHDNLEINVRCTAPLQYFDEFETTFLATCHSLAILRGAGSSDRTLPSG